MATADTFTETRMKTTLTLDGDETRALLAVLACVGGSPTNSPRKYIDAIADALGDATGISTLTDTRETQLVNRSTCSHGVYFRDYA